MDNEYSSNRRDVNVHNSESDLCTFMSDGILNSEIESLNQILNLNKRQKNTQSSGKTKSFFFIFKSIYYLFLISFCSFFMVTSKGSCPVRSWTP